MTQTIELTVNGARSVVTADPGTPLIYVLRNDLKLKGTRFGCGAGVFAGSEIAALGRLGAKAAAHPLQQAFVDEQAGQCGYCLTGVVMGAAALLARNPSPTEAEIRSELDIHLCRCGAYDRILRAIRRASEMMGRAR